MKFVEHKFHKKLQNYFLHFYSTKYHRQQPLYNTLELLMMGIVMPETCWASNKICKKPLLHLVGILFPHINDDARSKSHQICRLYFIYEYIYICIYIYIYHCVSTWIVIEGYFHSACRATKRIMVMEFI